MTPLSAARATVPAERALLAHLIDDAAVFPPGNAPLPRALSDHRFHHATPYAALLGPLLVPATAATELVALLADRPVVGPPLRVAVVARPGIEHEVVEKAVATLQGLPPVELAGAELGWTGDWRDLAVGDLALTLEVPRGPEQHQALSDIADARAAESGGRAVQVKFRTGATPTWPWPDEAELGGFIRAALDRGVPFKLTGGLHHVVRGTHSGEEQHGLLNVLAAVHRGLEGAGATDLTALLGERDPAHLVPLVAQVGAAEATRVREAFTAFGCCGVLDPISELQLLNLIKETP